MLSLLYYGCPGTQDCPSVVFKDNSAFWYQPASFDVVAVISWPLKSSGPTAGQSHMIWLLDGVTQMHPVAKRSVR